MRIRLEHLPADVVGLGPLSRAALAAGADFAPLRVPRRASEIPRPPEGLGAPRRGELARALGDALEELDPPPRTRTSLSLLARENVACVVTGQQPGFLGGPLLSLYKAMQACRLAHELGGLWGAPVVPVFWNHADDHDVAEVHHTWVLNRNLDLQKIGLAGMSSGRVPIGDLALAESQNRLSGTRSLLAQLFEEHAGTAEALELFFPREGESLARALTRVFLSLFGEHGLVVLEPPWLRAPLSRALADVVARDPRPALAAGSAELAALGLTHAIDPATAALLFHLEDGERRALRPGGEGFRYDGEPGSRTPAELAAEIVGAPEAWSAGALLRPLVQDAVLPVCATIGGFGELAYHAQLGPLRDAVGLARTPFVPRVSATLVDPETRASLARLGLPLAEVLRGSGVPPSDATEEPELAVELRAVADRAARELAELRPRLAELDRGLAAGTKRTAEQMRGVLEKLAVKVERVHQDRQGKGRRHERRVTGVLAPRGQPQERVLGPFPVTARFGRAWIEALYEEWPALSSEHLAVHLETEPTP